MFIMGMYSFFPREGRREYGLWEIDVNDVTDIILLIGRKDGRVRVYK